MVKFLIHKPVAVIMVFVALILLGIVAAERIPISPLPDIDIPEITVHVSKKNTSAKELESTIIRSLRTQLLQVPNLDDIHSETRDGYSIFRLRFNYGTDINYAFIEVNEKIDLSMNNFPRDMERPRVIKASATDIPVFYINLSLKDTASSTNASSRFIELSDFAGQVIKRRLEQLPEIAFVDITGVSYPEVYITPDPGAMSSLNLKEDDFKRIIESNNLIYGNVSAMDGVLQYNIRFASANPISLEDIRNISFKHYDRIFKLSDIATIGMRQQDPRGSFIAHNQPAINLAIIKQPDTKMDDLRSRIEGLVTGFERDYPEIRFEQTQDQTELLEYSISSLKQDLFIGSFLAFILMFFFLKNLRAPLLIGITIPVCLILSILLFNLIHLSINIISLSGLVLGVGLMIDNSIIVIDNITQYRERKAELSEACVKGTTEIIRPLLSSVMTTCSVFLPLIFLSGISGALFYDQAMAITIGLSVSLIVSVTLLPTLYRLFHKGKVRSMEHDFFEKYGITFFERMYESGFHWVFRNKLASLFIVTALIISNIFLFAQLKKEKLPAFKQTELVTQIDWNRNITIGENKDRVGALIKSLGKDIVQSNGMIGEQQYLLSKEKELSSSEAQLYLKTKDSQSLADIKNKIRNYLQMNYPEATLKLSPPKNIFEKVFGDDEPDLVVQLTQTGDETLPPKEKANQVSQLINQTFPGSDITPVAMQNTLALSADPEKLLLYDLSMDAVYNRLRSGLNSSEVSSLRNGQMQIPIVVSDQVNDLNQVLNHVTVKNNKGIAIPVSGFLKISKEETYKTIEGGKNGNYIPLAMETSQPEQVIRYVNQQVKGKDNLDVTFRGSYFSNKDLIKEMAIVLVVAVLLLYFILAAQFESLIQPLIVLFELPISMSGALIMLYIFNSSINLISLIGLVVMCGIIINDSILKIDTVNQLRRNYGYGLMDAIHTAGVRRLKAIIMTAMTTILSVAPFLFGSDMGSVLQRPLSLALIGGMLIGTPVSLYFIPLVYWFYYRKSDEKNKSDLKLNGTILSSGSHKEMISNKDIIKADNL